MSELGILITWMVALPLSWFLVHRHCGCRRSVEGVSTLYRREVTQYGMTWSCRFLEGNVVMGCATLNLSEIPSRMVAYVFVRDQPEQSREVGCVDEAEAWIKLERAQMAANAASDSIL